MSGQGLIQKITELLAPIAAAQRLELVDVEFKREGKVQYLRIFIDKPDGVTIDDCQAMSRECEVLLDIEDLIHTQYILEVSSPGLDRPLKTLADYERFNNRLVKIKTFQAFQGRKKFLGHLKGLTEVESSVLVTLHTEEGEDVQIPYNSIASARLEVEF